MGEQYFGEPWAVRETTGFDLTNRTGRWIGCFSDADGVLGSDMAARARDCVNAMTGIPDPAAIMEEMVEVLGELVTLIEAVISGDYKPDSFTCQPARALLAKLGRG